MRIRQVGHGSWPQNFQLSGSKISISDQKVKKNQEKIDFSKKCQNPPKWLFWHFFNIFKKLSKSCLRGLGVGKLVFWYKMPAYMLNFQKSQSHPWGLTASSKYEYVKIWFLRKIENSHSILTKFPISEWSEGPEGLRVKRPLSTGSPKFSDHFGFGRPTLDAKNEFLQTKMC